MAKYLLYLSLCLLPFLVAGQTLETYLLDGAEHNPALQAAYKEYQAALKEVVQARGLPDPQLDMGFFIIPVETRVGPQQARLGLMQMFPWFGTLEAKEAVAAREAEVAFQRFQALKSQYVYEVKALWFELYRVNASLQLTQENIRLLKSLENLTLTQYEAGTASMADVFRTQMKIREQENQLRSWVDARLPLQSRFNNLLGREASEPVSGPQTLPDFSPVEEERKILDSILVHNPGLAVLAARREAIEARKVLAVKAGAPNLGLGLNYVFTGKRTDIDLPQNGKDALMPMVSLSLPIWRKKYEAREEAEVLRLEANAFEISRQEDQLEDQATAAFVNLRDAGRRLQLFQEQEKQAEDILDLLLTAYSTTGKDFEEILRIQQEILRYQQLAVVARRDQHLAIARLEQLQGK